MAVRYQYEGRLIRFGRGSASHVFLLHGFFVYVYISALRMHELQI